MTNSVSGENRLSSECANALTDLSLCLFVCIEVLRPSQPNRVMSSAVSLPNLTFTGQAFKPMLSIYSIRVFFLHT